MVDMEKIWFIKIGDEEQGPFDIEDLKANLAITPDTLVRRKNWPNWVPIKDVAQLKEVFKDEPEDLDKENEEDEELDVLEKRKISDVLTMSLEPKHIFLWVILLLLLIVYLFVELS